MQAQVVQHTIALQSFSIPKCLKNLLTSWHSLTKTIIALNFITEQQLKIDWDEGFYDQYRLDEVI